MDIASEIRKDPENGARILQSEYKAGLTTLARRLCADESDAEELVNRTFAEVVRSIDSYLEQSAFFGWMCQILVNLRSKDLRRKSSRVEVADAGAVDAASDEDSAARLFRDVDAGLVRDAWPLFEDGTIAPVIHATLPIREAAEAHRAMQAGENRGKLVLEVGA